MTKGQEVDPKTGIPGDHKVHHDLVYPASEVPFLWDLAQLQINKIHEMGITGKGVTVCVMDTGFTPHPNLPTPKAKYNFTNSGVRSDVTDRNGHGNWCNGRTVGRGGIGIAKDADLIVAKVLGDDGSGRVTWSQEGRIWAAEQGADVTSVSIGGPKPRDNSVEESMERANQLGTLIECAAAGNAGHRNPNQDTTDSPGNAKGSIGCGSYDRDEMASQFTSAGPSVDIIGPGGNTTSTSHRGSGWATMSGTSMATPAIAGLIALTIDKHRQQGIPDSEMTGSVYWRGFIKKMAEGGFNKDGGAAGKDNIYGYGAPMMIEWMRYLGNYQAI